VKTMKQKPPSSRDSRIADQCATHLQREIDLLEKHIQISDDINERLGSSVTSEDSKSEEWLGYVAANSGALATERNDLKKAIAEYLGVPVQQATIRRVLSTLGPEHAGLIRQQFEKLFELEALIQKKSRTNSLLIRQTMDLYQRIAVELASPKTAAPTYSPTGELNVNTGSSFLQKDC
jgi:hypothetical protein